MRVSPRLALVLAALVVAPAGAALWSCGTSAVGAQACRTIEYERCQLAPMCTQGFDVNACERFYRDECLVGIQATSDTSDNDLNKRAAACNVQLEQVAGCVSGASDAGTCASLMTDASCVEIDASATPCNIILNCPEVLPACAFVGSYVVTVDAGSDAADTDDGGDASSDDAGDAASD